VVIPRLEPTAADRISRQVNRPIASPRSGRVAMTSRILRIANETVRRSPEIVLLTGFARAH
jgi:hypothetical protein